MTNAFINPLDLQTILVSTFSGSWTIFIFFALLLISIGAGIFRMNDKVYAALLVLFIIIMANYMGGLYLLAMLLLGLIAYYSIAKIVKQ